MAVRRVPQEFKKSHADESDLTDLTDEERWAFYAKWLEHDDPAVRANALICLINQANYLLDQQIAALEAQFIEEGGYSELLAAERLKQHNSNRKSPADPLPDCPLCGKAMVLRTAQNGKSAGRQFWGCSAYPDCKGVVNV